MYSKTKSVALDRHPHCVFRASVESEGVALDRHPHCVFRAS